MTEVIGQRQLRDDNAEIMRRVEAGESFVITRNGEPIADRIPHERRQRRRGLTLREAQERRRAIDPPLRRCCSARSRSASWHTASAWVTVFSRRCERRRSGMRLNDYEILPFSVEEAKFYAALAALVRASGRNPRPGRLDLQIAATAGAARLPLLTCNPADFAGLDQLVEVVPVGRV